MWFTQASSNRDPDPNEFEMDDAHGTAALSRDDPSAAPIDDLENGDDAESSADVPGDADTPQSHLDIHIRDSTHSSMKDHYKFSRLFVDFTWTFALSCFPSATPATGDFLERLISTLAFFMVIWWLWVSHTIWNARFQAIGGLYHLFNACHMVIFIAMGLLANKYDHLLGPDGSAPISDASLESVFTYLGYVFFGSRLVLLSQYGRVLYLLRQERSRSRKSRAYRRFERQCLHLGWTIYALLVSAGIFLVTSILTTVGFAGRGWVWSIVRAASWAVPLAFEVLAFVITPITSIALEHLRNRLVQLSVFAILHGVSMALVYVMNTDNRAEFDLTAFVIFQQVPVPLCLFVLMFLLYWRSFGGFNAESMARRKGVILAHYPIQLLMVLVMAVNRSMFDLSWFVINLPTRTPDGTAEIDEKSDPVLLHSIRALSSPVVWTIPLTSLYLFLLVGVLWMSGTSHATHPRQAIISRCFWACCTALTAVVYLPSRLGTLISLVECPVIFVLMLGVIMALQACTDYTFIVDDSSSDSDNSQPRPTRTSSPHPQAGAPQEGLESAGVQDGDPAASHDDQPTDDAGVTEDSVTTSA